MPRPTCVVTLASASADPNSRKSGRIHVRLARRTYVSRVVTKTKKSGRCYLEHRVDLSGSLVYCRHTEPLQYVGNTPVKFPRANHLHSAIIRQNLPRRTPLRNLRLWRLILSFRLNQANVHQQGDSGTRTFDDGALFYN